MSEINRRTILQLAASGMILPAIQQLAAAVENDPYQDAKLVEGPPAEIQAGSFTIAVLPDTQNYSQKFPEIFLAQTRWIVEQKASRNIAAVLHLGDITNTSSRIEWERARSAMQQLDGQVPYFMVPGNHDYSAGGSATDRKTLFSEYFPLSSFQELPTFGGIYDKEPGRMENSYHHFETAGRKFLVLCLEFGPRKDVVRWANEVAKAHPAHEVILITHAYMYYDDTRYDWKNLGTKQNWNPHAYAVAKNTGDDVTDGAELWEQLVSQHENFILTLNGHVLNDGLGRLSSQTPAGRDVHQMLVNYQVRPHGGDGWLRLLEFQTGGTITVTDYSPVLNKCNHSAQSHFELKGSPLSKQG